jgi:hypothetical protein
MRVTLPATEIGAALQHSRQKYQGASIRQALADQPLLDDVGDLHVVFVLHHHVAVALDANLGKVDPVDRTSRGLDRVGILGVDLFERRPARTPNSISTRMSFSLGALATIPAVADSTATMALILSGRCSATLKPKVPPWLCSSSTQGQTLSTYSICAAMIALSVESHRGTDCFM